MLIPARICMLNVCYNTQKRLDHWIILEIYQNNIIEPIELALIWRISSHTFSIVFPPSKHPNEEEIQNNLKIFVLVEAFISKIRCTMVHVLYDGGYCECHSSYRTRSVSVLSPKIKFRLFCQVTKKLPFATNTGSSFIAWGSLLLASSFRLRPNLLWLLCLSKELLSSTTKDSSSSSYVVRE